MSPSVSERRRRTILLRLSANAPASDVEKMISELREEAAGFPGVENAVIGEQTKDGSGFTHGISLDFASEAAFKAYREDERHRDIHNRYVQWIEDTLITDIRPG